MKYAAAVCFFLAASFATLNGIAAEGETVDALKAKVAELQLANDALKASNAKLAESSERWKAMATKNVQSTKLLAMKTSEFAEVITLISRGGTQAMRDEASKICKKHDDAEAKVEAEK